MSSVYLWRNRARSLNMRARVHGAEGRLSATMLRGIVNRDGSRCVFCGFDLDYTAAGDNSDQAPSFEHVVRLCDGGSNTPENVVCSCRGCNTRNNARSLSDPMGAALERLQRHLGRTEAA